MSAGLQCDLGLNQDTTKIETLIGEYIHNVCSWKDVAFVPETKLIFFALRKMNMPAMCLLQFFMPNWPLAIFPHLLRKAICIDSTEILEPSGHNFDTSFDWQNGY